MNLQLFILQGAMGAGIIMYYGGIALFIAFSVGYTSMYINIGKKKYLKGMDANQSHRVIVLYILCFTLGVITTALTIALLLGVLMIFIYNTPID